MVRWLLEKTSQENQTGFVRAAAVGMVGHLFRGLLQQLEPFVESRMIVWRKNPARDKTDADDRKRKALWARYRHAVSRSAGALAGFDFLAGVSVLHVRQPRTA